VSNGVIATLRKAYPTKTAGLSDDQLTLVVGDYLRNQGRVDVEESDPDFRSQYLALRRARSPGVMAETGAAISAAVRDRLPASVFALGALAADSLAQERLLPGTIAEDSGDFLRGQIARENTEAAQRIAAAGGRTIQRVEDVDPRRPGDYLLYALPTFAENLPQLAVSLGVGALTRSPGALAGVSVAQNVAENYGNLGTRTDVDRGRAIEASLLGGIPAGLLDAASAAIPLSKVPGFKSSLAPLLERIAGRGGIRGGAQGLLTGAVSEGGTEALQELLGIAAEEYATGKEVPADIVRSRLINAGAAGALVGAPIAGVAGLAPSQIQPPPADAGQGAGVTPAQAPAVAAGGRTFEQAVKDIGTTPEEFTAASKMEDDVVPLPEDAAPKVTVAPSEIEGQGVKVTQPIEAGQTIAPAFIDGNRTPVGRFVNHDEEPTALAVVKDGRVDLVAAKPLEAQDEVTVDYAQIHDAAIKSLSPESGAADTAPAVATDNLPSPQTPAPAAPTETPQPASSLSAEPGTTSASATPAPVAVPFSIADFEPRRVARVSSLDATGDDGRGGRFAIALEKDGVVQVRNVYAPNGRIVVENSKDLVPKVKRSGSGRSLEVLEQEGWKVRRGPFQLAAAMPSLVQTMQVADFDAVVATSEAAQEKVVSTINEGKSGELAIELLSQVDRPSVAAIDFLQTLITDATGADRSRVLAGLAEPVDSVAKRDSLRASATIKKLADVSASSVLAKRRGKILGIFTAREWSKFAALSSDLQPTREASESQAAGRPLGSAPLTTAEEFLLGKFKGDGKSWKAARERFRQWAEKATQEGTERQVGKKALAGGRAVETSLDVKPTATGEQPSAALEAQASAQSATSEETTGDIPLKALEGQTVGAELRMALKNDGLETAAVNAALKEMADYEELTRDDVIDILSTAPESAAWRKQFRDRGGKVGDLSRIIDNLLSLHETQRTGIQSDALSGRQRQDPLRGADREPAAGLPGAQSGASRAQEAARRSQPLVEPQWRASAERVQRAWTASRAALFESGLDVRTVQAAVDSIDEFYRSTGGRTDARRFVELVLKDITAPSPTDLEVAAHEAVHVLFATESAETRAAINRAVSQLADPDPATNRSLLEPDPEKRMQEKLAVLLQAQGIKAGEARGLGQKLVRFLKDIYLRVAQTIATAMGRTAAADRFALRYFRNRLDAFLNRDFAPRAIANALGGRPLQAREKAMLLPGFGRALGRIVGGEFAWEPKAPDSAEAVDFNLELAFSQPGLPIQERNIADGVAAVNTVVKEKRTVPAAMFRPEVGAITFDWGDPGNAAKAFKGGYGWSHILARRVLIDGMKPTDVARRVVETIARGEITSPYGISGDPRVAVEHDGWLVALSLRRFGERETWLVSGMEKREATAGTKTPGFQGAKASQGGPTFTTSDLGAAIADFNLQYRPEGVNGPGVFYSQPGDPALVGAVDNPVVGIHTTVAALNEQLVAEQAVEQALAQVPEIVASSGGVPLIQWFRSEFKLADSSALLQRAVQRPDPTTGQPVQGVDATFRISGFSGVASAARARILAYQSLWKAFTTVLQRGQQAQLDRAALESKRKAVVEDFLEAHRNYLDAEGLTALVLKGVRGMIARERKLGPKLGQQAGILMQQLRQLDEQAAETIDREYAPVFKKLFAGRELSGRNLFNYLDAMVNEARVDFDRPATEIRQLIAERVAAGQGAVELGTLVNATKESRALLATVIAYAKSNKRVLLEIERRRLKNVAERMELQQQLDKLIKERSITDQAVRDLPKTAKLEERARLLYQQEKDRARAIERKAARLDQRAKAAAAAVPAYRAALQSLQKELGLRPHVTFGDGMTYHVPDATGALQPRTLRLASTGQLTDRATLDRDLAAMTEWLDLNRQHPDWLIVKAERDELLAGGYFDTDLRKVDEWLKTNFFAPVGHVAAGAGTASGRIVDQMFNRFAAVEQELRQKAQKMGVRNERFRDDVIDVLNRGRATADMTVDRYYALIAEPAISIIEKSRDLQELGLSGEQVMARVYQRVINHLVSQPDTESYVRGKEQDVQRALRKHLDAIAETSEFYHSYSAKAGVGVRDERLITERDGQWAPGIRDSAPVGIQTFSRGLSQLAKQTYRVMTGRGWGTFKDAITEAGTLYRTQGRDAVRAALAPFFADRQVVDGFMGALTDTEVYSPFDAPVLADMVTRPEADPSKVAEAWRAANGDVVTFIEAMHALHGGTTDVSLYVQETLNRIGEYYSHLSEMLDSGESGVQPDGLRKLSSNLMIDARTLDRWPTAWSEHLFFDQITNHNLNRRVAAQVAFGRDTERLAEAWATLEREIEAAESEYQGIVERERLAGGKGVDKRVLADYVARLGDPKGRAEYARHKRMAELAPTVRSAKEQIRHYFGPKNSSLEVTRFGAQLGQVVAFNMLNQPGTALLNLADLFAPVFEGGVSGATMKQVLRNWKYLGENIAGSLAQAVGLDIMTSSRLQQKYAELGFADPAVAMEYFRRTQDGIRSDVLGDKGRRREDTGAATRILRLWPKIQGFAINLRGEEGKFTGFRPLAPFQQFVLDTARAATMSMWRRAEDMVQLGLTHLQANPAAWADPAFRIEAKTLGLKGAEAVAFDTMRRKMADGYALELTTLVREAAGRGGAMDLNQLLSDRTRATLQGLVLNEMVLDGNLATMNPRAFTSSFLRFALPLWGWPIRRAMQVTRLALDDNGQIKMEAVTRGLYALGVMTASGMAMSMLVDEYNENILKKKRNLRSVKDLPDAVARGATGEAFLTLLEATNRAGTFGFFGEVVNSSFNFFGGDRQLSFDQRIVMANSILTTARALNSFVNQGEADYANVVRPIMTALGGNGALQYWQIANNALDLDNIESRFSARVNAQNWMRVYGRQLSLEVRTSAGGMSAPNEMTPHLTRMVLATYAEDRGEFIRAWRAAVQEAQDLGKEDPVGYVRDSFASRNPLKTVFRSLSEQEFRQLIGAMPSDGRRDVMDAVGRFNAYAESLDAKAYWGSGSERSRVVRSPGEQLVQQLRRQAGVGGGSSVEALRRQMLGL
jgi:hypothetical protein